ncbi:MAG: 3'(2'),5'-bisphosphate nucleotidase [Myxococcota bacterium]|nr:3'(2'),5'-bisphosphate nucleotidase [Myxococcota bacterium]
MAYDVEFRAGVVAVRAAARVCRSVQQRLATAEALQKKDKSPVTVADFASQAIVCEHLMRALPDDAVVGEEGSEELRQGDQTALLDAVVREVSTETPAGDAQVLDWIDRGGAAATTDRYWTLDPIDGTKGFLRGEHYAVALALLEQGEVVVGVLGCPNLDDGHGGRGALFTAIRGEGTRALPLWDAAFEGPAVSVSSLKSTAEARFCESVESGHSNQEQSARIASQLGITHEPFRIDSQCKYAAIARGDASIYLRMPTRKDYREKIWDHAAGKLVVEEAGGRVTDVEGIALDFTHGRTLDANRGVVATCGPIHDRVIEAVRKVRSES